MNPMDPVEKELMKESIVAMEAVSAARAELLAITLKRISHFIRGYHPDASHVRMDVNLNEEETKRKWFISSVYRADGYRITDPEGYAVSWEVESQFTERFGDLLYLCVSSEEVLLDVAEGVEITLGEAKRLAETTDAARLS